MRKSSVWLVLALLLATLLAAGPVSDAKAGAVMAGNMAGAIQHQPLVQPVLVWRDCQRIARCYYGCNPCSAAAHAPISGNARGAGRANGPMSACGGRISRSAPRGVPVY